MKPNVTFLLLALGFGAGALGGYLRAPRLSSASAAHAGATPVGGAPGPVESARSSPKGSEPAPGAMSPAILQQRAAASVDGLHAAMGHASFIHRRHASKRFFESQSPAQFPALLAMLDAEPALSLCFTNAEVSSTAPGPRRRRRKRSDAPSPKTTSKQRNRSGPRPSALGGARIPTRRWLSPKSCRKKPAV